MRYFLSSKHWQIFLLIIGLPILGNLLGSRADINVLSIYSIATIISGLIFFAWLWSIQAIVGKSIDITAKNRSKRFQLIFFAVILYFTVSLILIYSGMYFDSVLWFIIHCVCIAFVLIIFYQCAKLIKFFELGREPEFGEVFFYFALVWFFPIGIWVLQPKLNKILERVSLSRNIV